MILVTGVSLNSIKLGRSYPVGRHMSGVVSPVSHVKLNKFYSYRLVGCRVRLFVFLVLRESSVLPLCGRSFSVTLDGFVVLVLLIFSLQTLLLLFLKV